MRAPLGLFLFGGEHVGIAGWWCVGFVAWRAF